MFHEKHGVKHGLQVPGESRPRQTPDFKCPIFNALQCLQWSRRVAPSYIQDGFFLTNPFTEPSPGHPALQTHEHSPPPHMGPNSSLLQVVHQHWCPTWVAAARPYPWSRCGDLGKTGAIPQRGKAAVNRKENFGDSSVHSSETPREQIEEAMLGGPSLGGREGIAHGEDCWQ